MVVAILCIAPLAIQSFEPKPRYGPRPHKIGGLCNCSLNRSLDIFSDIFFEHQTSDCTESAGGRRRDLRVEQEFRIAFAAEDWRLDPFGAHASEFYERRLYPGHGRSLCRFVAHNSAFTHQFPARFELRFHQHHNLANDFGYCWRSRIGRQIASQAGARRSRANHRRQHQGGGDEGDIHNNEVNRLANVRGFEIAGVGSLHKPNTRIVAQAEIHLAITAVYGNHLGGAVLQHAAAEASRGSTDVETDFALQIDLPLL